MMDVGTAISKRSYTNDLLNNLNIMTSVAKHQMILLIMVPLPGSGSSITGSTSHGMLLPRIVLPKDMFLHTQTAYIHKTKEDIRKGLKG
jgi:hypothetical protein